MLRDYLTSCIIYFTTERLNKINSKYSKYCPRCKIEMGTLLHMFWACTKLTTYWNTIAHTLSSVIKSNIQLDPGLVLLGDESSLLGINKNQIRFIKMAVIAATNVLADNRTPLSPY